MYLTNVMFCKHNNAMYHDETTLFGKTELEIHCRHQRYKKFRLCHISMSPAGHVVWRTCLWDPTWICDGLRPLYTL